MMSRQIHYETVEIFLGLIYSTICDNHDEITNLNQTEYALVGMRRRPSFFHNIMDCDHYFHHPVVRPWK